MPAETLPHVNQPHPEIYSSVLDLVGNTPCIQLNQLTKENGVSAQVVAKCEFFNASGSVKDRTAHALVVAGEDSGILKPGDTIVEPSSGNTGIALSMISAVKGYKTVITMPEKMSREREVIMKSLGAEVIRTPNSAAHTSSESHIGVAAGIDRDRHDAHMLNQYVNKANPNFHYAQTAEEIYRQCHGKVDAVVIAAGTGGTLSGVGRRLKELIPTVRVVGVDPVGSIQAGGTKADARPFLVEGIGHDFIPENLDTSVVDEWIKVSDGNTFQTARKLIRREGLLVGGSSGSAAWAALQVAKTMPSTARVVVILPDGVRNYLSRFVDDDWMVARGLGDFMEV